MSNILEAIVSKKKDKYAINEFNYNFFGEYIDRNILKQFMGVEKIYLEIITNIDNGQAYSSQNKQKINKLAQLLINIKSVNIIKNPNAKNLASEYESNIRNLLDNILVRKCYTEYVGIMLNRYITYLDKVYNRSKEFILDIKKSGQIGDTNITDKKIIINKEITETLDIEIYEFAKIYLYSRDNDNSANKTSIYLSNNLGIINKIYLIIDNLENNKNLDRKLENIKSNVHKGKKDILNLETLRYSLKGNNNPKLMFKRIFDKFSKRIRDTKKEEKKAIKR